MRMSDQHHTLAALHSRDPIIYCTGEWVGPTAGLDAETIRNIGTCGLLGDIALKIC